MASGGSKPMITGTYKATGSALTIDIVGFPPKYIKFLNFTTGAVAEWSDTMADDACLTHDSGTDAAVTSGGVTPTDTGFTLGTNAVLNTVDDLVHYMVMGD